MPILHKFEYHRPATIREAVKQLAKYKRPAVLAGGTDLINNLKEELDQPDAVIDVKAIPDMSGIAFKNGVLTIGAAATFTDLIESKIVNGKFPAIAEVANTVGSVGVRNRATMVGNICSCVPCADSGPLLIAYEAAIVVRSAKAKRRIPAAKWFLGNRKNALKKGELVTAIEIPLPSRKHAGCYVKLGRYSGEDLAQASVLILALPRKQYRIAFGSVAPVPIRAAKLEAVLNGHNLSEELIAEARNLIKNIISPITDIRATKEYRLHICEVMFERGLRAAAERFAGSGPAYGTSLI
ncbi:xanthine dehydrogenase family protein subunit M [candidate division KSB1 bacterium]|nr:MAG: xanthine dehydrogenase family protein subunit M [candidate division KSB1 bacterium]